MQEPTPEELEATREFLDIPTNPEPPPYKGGRGRVVEFSGGLQGDHIDVLLNRPEEAEAEEAKIQGEEIRAAESLWEKVPALEDLKDIHGASVFADLQKEATPYLKVVPEKPLGDTPASQYRELAADWVGQSLDGDVPEIPAGGEPNDLSAVSSEEYRPDLYPVGTPSPDDFRPDPVLDPRHAHRVGSVRDFVQRRKERESQVFAQDRTPKFPDQMFAYAPRRHELLELCLDGKTYYTVPPNTDFSARKNPWVAGSVRAAAGALLGLSEKELAGATITVRLVG